MTTTTKMMNQTNYDPEILEEYIRMSKAAQVLEADLEYGHDVRDEFNAAVSDLLEYRERNGITKEALTAHSDKKRGARKASSVSEALGHMENIFGKKSRGV